jgi:sugar phosphate permease
LNPNSTATRLRARGSKVFYGWWIVAAGFASQAIAAALLQRSQGLYVAVLRDEFGWSKAALSGAFSLQQIENGMLGPLQGWLIDRFGPKLSMRVGVLMFGLGFMAFSQINSLTGYYIVYLMMALGTSLGGYFPFTVVLVNWFEKRRARALSSFQMGGAVGGLLVVIVAFALEHFGWRSTAFISGIIVIATGLPLTQVVRTRPQDMGLRVDGEDAPPPGAIGTETTTAGAVDGFTLKQAMRTSSFWFISFGHGSALLIVAAVQVHLVLHLEDDLGFSLALAATAVAIIQASQMAGTFLGSLIGDRYDKRFISMWCMLSHSVGMLLFAVADNELMVFTAAILHGVAWGLRGPMMAALRADYFGRVAYGAILGTSSLITMFGSIAGPLIAGYLADQTGSYEEGFILLAILSGMGSVFFWLARKPPPPKPEPVTSMAERDVA